MPPASKDRDRDSTDATGLELRRVRDRELELKRTRGEISCAECRRLKLRCDKKAPCSSCIRRGCQQICPTGTNAPATRLMLAASAPDQRMQRKLTAMSERIRALEDALQIEVERPASRKSRSGDGVVPHPLLAPDLLAIKRGIGAHDAGADESTVNEGDGDEEVMMGAFGTLSIAEDRSMRFLGASATEQLLLMEVFEPNAPLHGFEWSTLPPELAQVSTMWPFAPLYLPKQVLAAQVATQLPPLNRATALYEAYFENLSWFLGPVDRTQVVEDLIPLFYTRRRAGSSDDGNNGGGGAGVDPAEHLHDLALLLMVFACGAVADLTLPPNNPEAERYHQLARAALGLQSPFDGGSLSACQACFLLGSYEVYSGRKTSQEASWKFMSLGLSLAASIGLHRDPARWKLEPKMVYRRRRVFWEIFLVDNWKSLGTGRPPLFSPNVIDCEFPEDRDATMDEDGTVVASVWRWRYLFARDVLPYLAEKLCSARTLKYSEILELDRRVRDFDDHPHLTRPPPDYGTGNDAEFRRLHPLVCLWFKELAFLFIHRNFFARAILDFPHDPMRSPFAPSFLATYRSATTILRTLREMFDKLLLVLFRMWPTWAHALSASVIVGSASCRPAISFASSAFVELEKAIELFKKATSHPVVKHGLPLLLRLREKALASLFNSQQLASHAFQTDPDVGNRTESGNDDPDQSQLARMSIPTLCFENDQAEEELLILRGTTRFVELRSAPAPSPPAPSTIASAQDTYPAWVREHLSLAMPTNSAPSPGTSASASSRGTMPSSAALTPSDADASLPESHGRTRAQDGAGKRAKKGSALFGDMDMARLLAPSTFVQERAVNTSGSGQSEPIRSNGPASNSSSDSMVYANRSAYARPSSASVARSKMHIEMARTWLSGVEQDRAAAISARLSAQQQQQQQQQEHQEQHAQPPQQQQTKVPLTAARHPQQQQQQYDHDQWSWPSTSSMMSATEHRPLPGASNASAGANADPSAGFDPTAFDALLPVAGAEDPFMSFPVSFTPMVDPNALYQSGEAVAAEAWRAFVQQAGLMDTDPALDGWEGVVFT